MSKFSGYIRTASIYVVLLCVFSCTTSALILGQTLASPLEVIGGEMGLRVVPEDTKLFDIKNIYPGMEASSLLTVRNDGSDSLALSLDVLKERGDDILFNGLEVIIFNPDSKKTYYHGSMSGANDAAITVISAGEAERLNFTVSMSPEAGNEYQGKSLDVKWVLTAVWEQTIDPEPPGGNGNGERELPVSGGMTLFIYIAVGGLLVLCGTILFRKGSTRQ